MKLSAYRERFQKPKSAESYAQRFESGSRRRISARELNTVERIFNSLPECVTVLDIPCGAGRLVPAIAKNGRQVQGIDVSEALLELARQRHGNLATFSCGDASNISLPDKAVDCVLCNRLLHHLDDPADRLAVMRELHRVTRRWAVISFFNYHRWKLGRKVARWIKGAKPSSTQPVTREKFMQELLESGFTIEREVPVGGWFTSEGYFIVRR